LDWWLLINGRRAPFVGSGAARSHYRVYARLPSQLAVATRWGLLTAHLAAATPGVSSSCVIATGDFGEPLTRPNFGALETFVGNELGSQSYYTAHDERSVAAQLRNAYDAGCRDAVLYLNGNQGCQKSDQLTHYVLGQAQGPYVSLSSTHSHGVFKGIIKFEILTAPDLRASLLAVRKLHPDLGVTLIVEACHAGNWVSAINPKGKTPAADGVFTSVGPDEFSIGSLDPAGKSPSPFLGAVLGNAQKYLGDHASASLGRAIGAVAGQVKKELAAVGKALYGGKWPQDPQYSSSVSGQIVGHGAVVPCGSPSARVSVDLRFSRQSGQVLVAPPGRTVDFASSPTEPSIGQLGIVDICYGGAVTVKLTEQSKDGYVPAGWGLSSPERFPCKESGYEVSHTATCTVTFSADAIASAGSTGVSVEAVPVFCSPTNVSNHDPSCLAP
jgi:hypothetical protein